jgi:hypothetical protein
LKQSKDIPNEDFECNPTGSCWCKEEEYKLPIPDNSELCYSPREIKKIIKKA